MTIMNNKDERCEKETCNEIEEQIVELIANEKNAFFKNQQRNEQDLSLSEKKMIVENLLHTNKTLFLQRYGQYLDMEKLNFFQYDPSGDVCLQVEYLRSKIQSKSKLLRNRRYQALQNLLKEGSYFLDSEMQSRNPFLFEQMIGRYMNEQEKQELQHSSYVNNYDRIEFSSYLFEAIRQARMERQSLIQEKDFQIKESLNEDEEENYEDNLNISKEKKELLRKEFLDIMIQNFLNGKDKEHFDYDQVDQNEEFDINQEFERDQEEKYFESDN